MPLVPAIRDQLIHIERHQDSSTKMTHASIDTAIQLERELVARLMAGGSWADVSTATGLTRRRPANVGLPCRPWAPRRKRMRRSLTHT